MGSEIVTIHVGQAGVQISHALWELVCIEHGVGSDGLQIWNESEYEYQEFGRDLVFREVGKDKFVPRALLVDLEPTVVDEIRTGAYRELWHPQQLITGKEDAASNFARGYYSQSRFELNEVTDRIRILVEQCDHLACFKLLYSANGGTGSGLTSALCERLSDEYGKKYKFATTVYPSPGYSELMVEPYNSLLHSSTNLTFCDCVVLTDNEAMLNVVEDTLKLPHAGFVIPNRVIANAVTTQFLSHRYRFIGQQHAHVNELLINLIPYPRIHFPMMAFAPFYIPSSEHFEKCTATDLVRSVFEDTNQLLSVSAVRRAYISCALLFRGAISPIEAINAITTMKADRMNRARFVDWCPTGFKLGVNAAPPVQANLHNTVTAKHLSLTMIAGNLAIRDVWTGIGRRFDQLYQKRAYVHWYVAEGMEEGEFALAREVIQQLVDDYEAIAKDAEGTVLDSSTNYANDSGIKPIIRTTPRVNRSPLNPTEPNMNQATTLDDPNSLRTLENNEDAISLDTNQHHSNSIHSDAYQFTRLRLQESDDWRTVSGQIAKKIDTIAESQPVRKRRLRFPENAMELEENQNNALGLSVLARSGLVYGTNCSAAVTQRHCSSQIMSYGLHRRNRERRVHKYSAIAFSKPRDSFASIPVRLIKEKRNLHYPSEQTCASFVRKRQMERCNANVITMKKTDHFERQTLSHDAHSQADFSYHSPSTCSNQSHGSKALTRFPVTPPVNLVVDQCSLSCRTPSVQTDPNNPPNKSDNTSTVIVQSDAESLQDLYPSPEQLSSACSSYNAQARTCGSDLSPPQITPLRSQQVTTKPREVQSSHFSEDSSDRPIGFVCCSQLLRHRQADKGKNFNHHHIYQHQHRHHHYHYSHLRHHHKQSQHCQKHQHSKQRQFFDQQKQTRNMSEFIGQPCQVTIQADNDLICTSNDVSEITVRSSVNTADQGHPKRHVEITPIQMCDHRSSVCSQKTTTSATVTPRDQTSSTHEVGSGSHYKHSGCSKSHNYTGRSVLSDMNHMKQSDLPQPLPVELQVQASHSDGTMTGGSHEFALRSTISHHLSDTLDQSDVGFEVPPKSYPCSNAPSFLDQP
ncbi:Tubulin alpha-A chain [Fasciola hepatica]|uniref:Tubulin alpha-A chain n=1 Tax=Fasciola hepatica TaxID=6192 RepID=A0A4E0R809_FASHE|nr:Tubulin alpha-A chain [Fasciola hepatica]